VFQKEIKGHSGKENPEAEINELYRQIGQLKVERDFLARGSAKLGLSIEKPW
jgi:hypothetical protein